MPRRAGNLRRNGGSVMHGNQKMGRNGNTAKEVYNFTKNPKPCSSLKIGVKSVEF